MSRRRKESFFWTSYSDLMTSMFFVMLVLFVLCMVSAHLSTIELRKTKDDLEKALLEANAKRAQLEQILQLQAQFKELSQSTALEYVEEKKMFVAKDFVGIEIFRSNEDVIKDEYLTTVDTVGQQLQRLVRTLHEKNPEIQFQLVIEGTAAIKYSDLKSNTYNADDIAVYNLSFNRALALYNRWRSKGVNLRHYNTEILLAGSGFNGDNRDLKKEDNNKRFVIQIIPKVSRPAEE